MFIRQTQTQSKLQVVQNKDVLSEFNGPSVFTSKVTSTSKDGIEAVSFTITG